VYLEIADTESELSRVVMGSPRLNRDLIKDCDLDMRLLDSSVGAFAITSLHALFAILGV
jgi:hypothetical protein